MAEKSKWSLGAKLKGIFSRSKEEPEVQESTTPVEPVVEEIETPPAPVAVKPREQVPGLEPEPVSRDVPEITEEPEEISVVPVKPKKKISFKAKPKAELVEEVAVESEPDITARPEPEPALEAEQLVPEVEIQQEPVTEPVPELILVAKGTEKPAAKKTSRAISITEDTWEELEETLLTADFGPDITDDLMEVMRSNVAKYGTTDPEDFVRMLREAIEDRLNKFDTTLKLSERPAVILVVGVNGVGKTTTIGKVAKYISNAGKSVVVGAADTFRAAAVDQLATWAERAGVDVVRPQIEGQDPSAVAYQTIESAIKNGTEIVIIDTAGRLQTKSGLMDELSKIRRVIEKQAPISEVLLVLDATTGQNGLSQAEAFLEHAGVTGLVLTKLDGSAKGGFVLAVQEKTGIPVKLVGIGEGINDLIGFTPHAFAAQLVG